MIGEDHRYRRRRLEIIGEGVSVTRSEHGLRAEEDEELRVEQRR